MACISPCSTCHVPFRSRTRRVFSVSGAAIAVAAPLRRRYLTTRAPGFALITKGSPCSISSLPLKLADRPESRSVISYLAEASIPLRWKVAEAFSVFLTAKRLDDSVSLLGPIELPGEPVLLVAAVACQRIEVALVVGHDLSPLGGELAKQVIVEVFAPQIVTQDRVHGVAASN